MASGMDSFGSSVPLSPDQAAIARRPLGVRKRPENGPLALSTWSRGTPGVRVALDHKHAISRPVCWTATGLMVGLEEWNPMTSSKSGFATQHLDDAQRERVWAIVEAHQSGLSVRQIATATGL